MKITSRSCIITASMILIASSPTSADDLAVSQFPATTALNAGQFSAQSPGTVVDSEFRTPFTSAPSAVFPLDSSIDPAEMPRSPSPEIALANYAALDMGELPDSDSVRESDSGCCIHPGDCSCQEAVNTHKNTGFMNLNYFWDDRDANWFTVYTLAALPHDVTYFSLLNLVGQFDQPSETENLTSFYTEQNLWHPISKDSEILGALDYSVQWVDASFLDPLLRLGVQWRVKDTAGPLGEFFTNVLGLDYRVYFHAIETDGSGIQIEHFYLKTFQDGLFYIRGFADHDINTSGNSDWVSGAQAGVRVVGNLYLTAEHRYNSFQPPGRKSGWKLGFEYQIGFR